MTFDKGDKFIYLKLVNNLQKLSFVDVIWSYKYKYQILEYILSLLK